MHLGLICPEFSGHLNPMLTLGGELRRRGHWITVIARPDAAERVVSAGFGFQPVGEAEFPVGSIPLQQEVLGKLSSLAALRHTIGMLRLSAQVILRDGPIAAKKAGIDAFLVDQVTTAGGTVADSLGLPYVQVCNAMALNPDPWCPPAVLAWHYRRGWPAELFNRAANELFRQMALSVGRVIDDFRMERRLPPLWYPHQVTYLAEIAQQPEFFDFPRSFSPPRFRYTAPWHHSEDTRGISFPWERLDGRPLVYACLGTLQNRMEYLFETIAEAMEGTGCQLILSLGGAGRDASRLAEKCHGDPIIVPEAPQPQLIHRADLVITHGGLNTVLESLKQGVPMVAIPIANDQPGVARRMEWIGAGEMVPLSRATPKNLREAAMRVMQNSSYRVKAQWCRERIRSLDGLKTATDIVESVLGSGESL